MATRNKKADKPAASPSPGDQEAAAGLNKELVEPVAIPAPVSFAFATEDNSPFSDGYSIAGEEAALATFLGGPMDEADPLYDRYIELEDRRDRLERMQQEFKSRRLTDDAASHRAGEGRAELGIAGCALARVSGRPGCWVRAAARRWTGAIAFCGLG